MTQLSIDETEPTSASLETSANSQRIRSNDYRAWDKFVADRIHDDDAETTDDVSGEDRIVKERTQIAPVLQRLPEHTEASIQHLKQRQSDTALEALAEKEKQKGNECMRSGELDEAIRFYSRSLSLFECPSVLANRCLAYLKYGSYERAVQDADAVLQRDAGNVKVWMRRGLAQHQRGRYQEAVDDFNRALELSRRSDGQGNPAEIQRYLETSEKKLNEVGGIPSAPKPKTRMVIQEDAEEEVVEPTVEADEESEISDDEDDVGSAKIREL